MSTVMKPYRVLRTRGVSPYFISRDAAVAGAKFHGETEDVVLQKFQRDGAGNWGWADLHLRASER